MRVLRGFSSCAGFRAGAGIAVAVCVYLLLIAGPGRASASSVAPGAAWSVRSTSMPTYISPTTHGVITLLIGDKGAAATDGSEVTITTTLPAGVTVAPGGLSSDTETSCVSAGATVQCTYGGVLAGDNTQILVVRIRVEASTEVTGLATTTTVSGGGATEASVASPVTVSSGSPPFGIANFAFESLDAAGAPDVQAGSHPNILVNDFDLNSVAGTAGRPLEGITLADPVQSAGVELPLGFIGNPQTAAKCPQADIGGSSERVECPAASMIGTVAYSGETASYLDTDEGGEVSALYNVVPQAGYPAEFGFSFLKRAGFIYVTLAHTSMGYVLRSTTPGIPLSAGVKSLELTFFGDPAVHDGGVNAPAAFFTNSTDCAGGASAATFRANSEPEDFLAKLSAQPAVTGCDLLHFEPTIAVVPEMTQVDTPNGYHGGPEGAAERRPDWVGDTGSEGRIGHAAGGDGDQSLVGGWPVGVSRLGPGRHQP